MKITDEMIELAKTPKGGWTKEVLAGWGVTWPPRKGWKEKLIADGVEVPTRQELIDALAVMIYAWEAKTTVDGRKMIGLGADIHFPLMPRKIKSYDDAKAVFERAQAI